MRTRTEITIETERLLVVGHSKKTVVNTVGLWCRTCAQVVPMLSLDEAARIESTTLHAIYRLAETGRLHFELEKDQIFICSNSLASERPNGASTEEPTSSSRVL